MAKSIMIQGTSSSVGKSLLTAGLCRILAEDGYRVAPFKSQNMALNSFVTSEGLEIGRAQAMQAEAAFKTPDTRMNPILLKPTGDKTSQVVVNGEVLGTMTASEYYDYKMKLIPDIVSAYNSLSDENDIIVIEGAGSPAEINLNSSDIVNMGMAKITSSPVLLAGDIDRGGVFASLYGTVMLLPENERDYIKSIIINKFRGDINLLKPGLDMLYDLIHIPVIGVVPYINIDIDDEDSLSPRLSNDKLLGVIDIAVIRLPHISNFTDFSPLERIRGVTVRYVSSSAKFGEPDMVIIPGTKNTMADLEWVRENGFEKLIKEYASRGLPVIGICGGYQMLSKNISDPYNAEHGGQMAGLGLLDAETVFATDKRRTRVSGALGDIPGVFAPLSGSRFDCYEIHMGETFANGVKRIEMNSGNIFGTYYHGFFDSADILNGIAKILFARKSATPPDITESAASYKEKSYKKLADTLRESLDIKSIYEIINKGV